MFGIHDEHAKKKVSTVVYIAPQYGSGTFLYNENKELVKQVAWKPNRAFIFSGIPGVTWHDEEVARVRRQQQEAAQAQAQMEQSAMVAEQAQKLAPMVKAAKQ